MSTAAAHSTSVTAAVAAVISSVFFFVGEKDGVNKSVRALSRLDASSQTLFAAAVHSIGEDYESFASLLLFRDFIRCEVYRVVQQGAAPTMTAPSHDHRRMNRRFPSLKIAALPVDPGMLRVSDATK